MASFIESNSIETRWIYDFMNINEIYVETMELAIKMKRLDYEEK